MEEGSREISYGTRQISYTLRRSAKRGTVSIAIDSEIGVLVTAPEGTPAERIDGVVYSKGHWIVEKLRLRSEWAAPVPAREFVSGESYLYLGKQYTLRVLEGEEDEVHLRGSWLEVSFMGRDECMAQRQAELRRKILAWYIGQAEERLPERVKEWAGRLGQEAGRILIREQKKRWGSCSAQGTLRLNWRLMQAPMRLVDYVVAHELVHRIQANHTRAFWRLLGDLMPDYEERKGELKRLGPALLW